MPVGVTNNTASHNLPSFICGVESVLDKSRVT